MRAPFIYPWRLVSRLERRFEADTLAPVPLRWFTGGTLVTADPEPARRCCCSAPTATAATSSRACSTARGRRSRVSLVSALLATCSVPRRRAGGYLGGWLDDVLSRVSEFVLVLPAIYVALVLRAVLPLVLPPATVFLLLIGIFTLLGWPIVARGVRAIVLVEREREYAVAARAAGASDGRVLLRHLLPAPAAS